jgi:hypothetical protein
VIANLNPTTAPGNGYITDFATNTNIFNNTMLGSSTSNTGGTCIMLYLHGETIRNNICSSAYVGIYVVSGASISSSDYNDFSNLSSVAFNNSNWYGTVAGWRSSSGQDSHSVSGNALLTATFQLGNGSAGIGTGTNLSSLGINALDFDKANAQRPSGSASWDMGAYQTGTSSSAPNPPSGLIAVVN